jgi:undecaprenyl-diphosphatase
VAIAAVGAYAVIALASVVGPGATPVDARAFELAADVRSGALVDVSKVITALGALPAAGGATLLAVLALIWRGRTVESAVLLGGLVTVVAAAYALKAAEDRPRPPGELVATTGAAFPSGHATYSILWVAIAVALARAVPALSGRAVVLAVAIALAVAIGLTRVLLRAHYLTDVLAGWGLGAALLATCGVAGLVVDYVRHHGEPT